MRFHASAPAPCGQRVDSHYPLVTMGLLAAQLPFSRGCTVLMLLGSQMESGAAGCGVVAAFGALRWLACLPLRRRCDRAAAAHRRSSQPFACRLRRIAGRNRIFSALGLAV